MASFGNNEFSRLGRYKLADNQKFIGGNFAPFIPAISGTGAGTTTASPGNGYLYQTFTSSGTLLVEQPITADILIVGGGGAGGGAPAEPTYGSGGGAGGVVYFSNFELSAGTYVIGVGGGAGFASSIRGNPSYILTGAGNTLGVALGGGCGRSNPSIAQAQPGGSGGGGSPGNVGTGDQPATTQGAPSPSYVQYGNPGGTDNGGSTGGGGGAGAVGSNSPYPPIYYTAGGPGGIGVQFTGFTGPLIGVPSLSPQNGYYGGGGGGHGQGNPQATFGFSGGGGAGGGGTGSNRPSPVGPSVVGDSTSGQANTGGGGGGTYPGPSRPAPSGWAGGSGIVVIRYQVSP